MLNSRKRKLNLFRHIKPYYNSEVHFLGEGNSSARNVKLELGTLNISRFGVILGPLQGPYFSSETEISENRLISVDFRDLEDGWPWFRILGLGVPELISISHNWVFERGLQL